MPRKKYKITKLANSKRWRKKYLGIQYYFPMDEYPTEEAAWNAWLKKKSQIDIESQPTKPFRLEYETAVRQRQDLAAWCREAEEHAQARIFQQEADVLLARFNRMISPPPLSPDEADPISSIVRRYLDEKQAILEANMNLERWPPEEREFVKQHILSGAALQGFDSDIRDLRLVWADRLTRFERVAPEKAISSHIATYLNSKQARAHGQEISLGYWGVLHAHMQRFQAWVGSSFPIESISAKTLIDYHLHLLGLVQNEEISRKYAADNMATVRQFVRWAWELDLCGLPRNINSKELRFSATVTSIETFTMDEIKSLLNTATERTRLYILLALNCGFTQVDCSTLRHTEVDWTVGTITRKRTKTRQHENVPTVCYKLWPQTFDLLTKHKSMHPDLVFVNQVGHALKTELISDKGFYRRTDTIRYAYSRLTRKLKITKPYKLLRKTGATKLGENKYHKSFVPLYLGHAPRSIAERHYAVPSQELFDEAIAWLGDQFEVAKIGTEEGAASMPQAMQPRKMTIQGM
jgi:hypothetical protein